MTRGSFRTAAACTLVVLTLAVMAWGRNAVVTTKDGHTFEGAVTEKGQVVTVMVKGKGPVKLNRANVESIEDTPGPADEFATRMAKLARNDAPGRVELARWALENEEYELSLDAVEAALAIDPENEDARVLKKTVLAKQKAARTPAPKGVTAPPAKAGAVPTPPADAGAAAGDKPTRGDTARPERGKKPIRLVTPEEINRIRQLELQKGENVQIRLQNGVKQKYLASSEFTPQKFNAMTPQQQGFEILNNGSSKLHADVVIASDPVSIAQFKSAVQRNVLPGCASAACHAATNTARPFTLHNPANKENETYTNFLLMQDYKTTIEGKEYLMVDRARPESSLLLMYGMPQEVSAMPHPKAQNFHPIFKGKNDPKFKQVLEWESKTLAAIAPEYGINLSAPPEGDATTRPARKRMQKDVGDDAGGGATERPAP